MSDDPRQEDRERVASEPFVATHSDEACEGCGKRIVEGEPIEQHRGHWLHASEPDSAWTCADDLDAKLAEIDAETVELRTAFGGSKVVARELLDDRTQEQIDAGKLADDTLDPRGYVVTCEHCVMQWWGTPDNLPIRQPDKHHEGCPERGADQGSAAA